MKRTWPILIPAIVLSLFGAFISNNLIVKHLTGRTNVGWFDSVCESGPGSNVSCKEVLSSGYAMFPRIPEGIDPQKRHDARPVLGVIQLKPRPVALYGLFYYLCLAGWFIFVGRPDRPRRWLHALLLLFNLAGVAGSIYFLVIMFTRMEAWCPWCLVTHIVNGLLLICCVLLWPGNKFAQFRARSDTVDCSLQSPAAVGEADTQETPARAEAARISAVGDRRAQMPRYPSMRLVSANAVAVLATMAAFGWFYEYAGKYVAYQRLDMAMQRIRDDASSLYAMYQANEKYDITIRPDDPVRNTGRMRLTMVIFSDLQCPHCRRFAKKIDDELMPLFGEYLKVVFKHFPANKACNPKVRKDMHIHACRAATAAEAARKLGGNDAFWKAHDLIFAAGSAKVLAEFDYRALAEQLDLDPDEFETTMASDEVAQRIAEDIELAVKVKLPATPAVYLSGRQVPRIAVHSMVFWDLAKRKMDKVLVGLKAQEEAKRQAPLEGPPATAAPAAGVSTAQPATPSNPNP